MAGYAICFICDGAVPRGGAIAWRRRKYHPHCLLTAAVLFADPGSAERVEVAELLAPVCADAAMAGL